MKQNLKKILAFTMALTVLVSSHSFAYFEHLCTITQKKTLSFHLETCAGDFIDVASSDTPVLKKSVCCEIDLKVNKADNAVQQNHFGGFLSFIAEELILPQFSFSAPAIALSEQAELGFGDSSPPSNLPLYILNEQFIL